MTIVTAIIESVKIGKVDYHKDLMLTCVFDMNNSSMCNLSLTIDEALKMLDDRKLNNINELVGEPCEIESEGWGSECKFVGMWRK